MCAKVSTLIFYTKSEPTVKITNWILDSESKTAVTMAADAIKIGKIVYGGVTAGVAIILVLNSLPELSKALEKKAETSKGWAFVNNAVIEGAERSKRYHEQGDPYPGLSSEFGPSS